MDIYYRETPDKKNVRSLSLDEMIKEMVQEGRMGGWPDIDERRVDETEVGFVWVSTVFLVIDHSFGRGTPLLFETMVFPRWDGPSEWEEVYSMRYHTRAEAELGHDLAVEFFHTWMPGLSKDPLYEMVESVIFRPRMLSP